MVTKKSFFSDHYIQSFLSTLNKNLSNLPTEIREQHILEIESDLYSNAVDKETNGVKGELAQIVLKDYSSPKLLADEILAEYDTDIFNKENFKKINIGITLSIGGLVSLSLPITLNYLNLSASLPFLFVFLIGTFYTFFGNFYWNDYALKQLKKAITIFRGILIGLGFGMFALQIIIHHKFSYFSLYYLIGYIICCIIYFISLNYIYKRKNQ